MNLFLVFLGGGIGALLRHGVGEFWKSKTAFPMATLISNLLACVCLGIFVFLIKKFDLSVSYQLLLVTGICGGFSTFSSFANENVQLFQQGNWEVALLNISLTILTCFGVIAVFSQKIT